jgi:hypothetical protein
LADLRKSSPLKPVGQMNRNLVGSIYGKSSIKIAHFVNNQKQELPVAAMFVNESGRNEQYRGPSKDAPYQVSIHLAKRFKRKIILD